MIGCAGSTRQPPVWVFVLLLWSVAIAAYAQGAALTGIVHDPSGQVLVGAIVIVFEDEHGQRWVTTTSTIGYYEIELAPGDYHIAVHHGPMSYQGLVRVYPAEKAALDITLSYHVEDKVTVAKDPSSLETTNGPPLGETLRRAAIDGAFLTNGRTVQTFVGLVPGVVVTDSVGTLAQFTAIGQRRFANRLTLDGIAADLAIDVGNPGIGQPGSGSLPALNSLGGTQTLVPLDGIETIKVHITDVPSREARTPGAQTIVNTRAGGERFSGSTFIDTRPNALAARDWFVNAGTAPKRETRLWTGGASVGGPLVAKRLRYFMAFERQHVDRDVDTTINVPSALFRGSSSPAVQALLSAFPVPNGAETAPGLAGLTTRFPASSDLSTVSGRMDATLPSGRLFVRFNYGVSHGDELDSLLQLPRYSFAHKERTNTNLVTAGLTTVSERELINELRVNTTRHSGSLVASPAMYGDAQSLPLGLFIPAGIEPADAWVRATVVAGLGSGFVLSGRSDAARHEQFEIADSVSWVRGRHEFEVGGDYRRLIATTNPAPFRYTYNFTNLTNLSRGRAQVLVEHDIPARAQLEHWSAYVQDAIRATSRLSFELGLRYAIDPAPVSNDGIQPWLLEPAALPNVVLLPEGSPLWRTSWGHVAPRLAATYRLATISGRETTLHAGWSILTDERTSPGASVFGRGYPFISRRAFISQTFPVTPTALSAPFPQPFEPGDLNEYYAFQRDLRSPRTYEWEVSLEQAIGASRRINMAYVGAAARNLPYWSAYYVRDAPINLFTDDARSDYHGLLAECAQRMAHGIQARATYAWSHAIDNDSGESDAPHLPPALASPATNKGSADFDRRHVLQITGSYRLPAPTRLRSWLSDWQIDAIGVFRSGGPITVRRTADFGDGFYEVRPDSVLGAPVWVADPSSPGGRRLNPGAFSVPDDARQGTLGRNALRANALRQIDLALTRSLRFPRSATMHLRLEVFNVLNTPNFGPPDDALSNVGFGFGEPYQTYAERLGTGTLSHGGLTPLQQIGGPRAVQFHMKFMF